MKTIKELEAKWKNKPSEYSEKDDIQLNTLKDVLDTEEMHCSKCPCIKVLKKKITGDSQNCGNGN